MSIKAILFDLDGTLSHMDNQLWMNNYLGLMTPRFAKFAGKDKFIKTTLKSTKAMYENREPVTNLKAFFDDFCTTLGVSFSNIWPEFIEFYRQDFPALQFLVTPDPLAHQAVEKAKGQGYRIGLACNPVMPKEAILERLRWAGVDDFTFEVVPNIEDMHFCKPQPEFFAELAEAMGLKPQECLVVANDLEEDLACKKIGMPIFLVTTEGTKLDVNADYQGTLKDFIELLENRVEF